MAATPKPADCREAGAIAALHAAAAPKPAKARAKAVVPAEKGGGVRTRKEKVNVDVGGKLTVGRVVTAYRLCEREAS